MANRSKLVGLFPFAVVMLVLTAGLGMAQQRHRNPKLPVCTVLGDVAKWDGAGYVCAPDDVGVASSNPDPPCFDNVNRYVECGNGTVTDTVTGVIFLQQADCFGTFSSQAVNYTTAQEIAAALADGQCGLSDGSRPGDWRLLTLEEAESMIALAVTMGCTNTGAKNFPSLTDRKGEGCFDDDPNPVFPDPPLALWTSSGSEQLGGSAAWFVNLFSGGTAETGRGNGNLVWPVRRGQ